MSPLLPLASGCKTLSQFLIPMFLSQSRATAGVKSFDPNILHPNNLHFRVVYSLCTQCVKAFMVILGVVLAAIVNVAVNSAVFVVVLPSLL